MTRVMLDSRHHAENMAAKDIVTTTSAPPPFDASTLNFEIVENHSLGREGTVEVRVRFKNKEEAAEFADSATVVSNRLSGDREERERVLQALLPVGSAVLPGNTRMAKAFTEIVGTVCRDFHLNNLLRDSLDPRPSFSRCVETPQHMRHSPKSSVSSQAARSAK